MKKIKIWNNEASPRQLEEVADAMRRGEIVIIPTDTLYGIACDALNVKAIDRLCRMKGINPEKTNLSVICSDISMAAQYARFGNEDFKLLRDNTPGPFTFLFKSAPTLPKAFKGRKTVGIRIPDNKFARELADALGNPVLTTSIQFRDEDYAVNPELIAEHYDVQADIMILGEYGDTVPSTIVDCTDGNPVITREGKGFFNL